MHFEEQYPNKPPSVKFISQMFHPNVYATGELRLDILQNRWSPTYDVAAVLTSIQRYDARCSLRRLLSHEMLTTPSSIVCLTIRTPVLQPTSRHPIYTKTTGREYTKRVRETVEKSWED